MYVCMYIHIYIYIYGGACVGAREVHAVPARGDRLGRRRARASAAATYNIFTHTVYIISTIIIATYRYLHIPIHIHT